MIKKEKYLKAKKIVRKFEFQLNSTFVKARTCAVCKTNVIRPHHPDMTEPLKQEQGIWIDGVVEKVNFGFGSKHDMDSFYIAICSDCIEKLEKDGFATNIKELKKEVKNYKSPIKE